VNSSLNIEQMTTLFVMFAIVAVLAIGGYLAAMVVRGRLLRDSQEEAFTLQDLRQMHARGELSKDEFENMRQVILGKAAERKQAAAQKEQQEPGLGEADRPGI
jgi:hypothetical protein